VGEGRKKGEIKKNEKMGGGGKRGGGGGKGVIFKGKIREEGDKERK